MTDPHRTGDTVRAGSELLVKIQNPGDPFSGDATGPDEVNVFLPELSRGPGPAVVRVRGKSRTVKVREVNGACGPAACAHAAAKGAEAFYKYR